MCQFNCVSMFLLIYYHFSYLWDSCSPFHARLIRGKLLFLCAQEALFNIWRCVWFTYPFSSSSYLLFYIYFFSEFHEEIHITFSSSSSLSFGVSFFLKLLFILFSTQNFYSNFLSMCNFLRKILPFFHEHNRVVYAWKFQFTFLFDFLALIH